jgi:hypothetical protein
MRIESFIVSAVNHFVRRNGIENSLEIRKPRSEIRKKPEYRNPKSGD